MWGITKKYPTMSWVQNFLGGHFSFWLITIYGANAMDFAVNIQTKRWGYICFTLPTWKRITGQKSWYFYLSPNATPWACTFYRGSHRNEKLRAMIRKFNFGHGFGTNKFSKELYALNQKFESLRISEYDVYCYSDSDDE